MGHCDACGAEVRDDDTDCWNCGEPLPMPETSGKEPGCGEGEIVITVTPERIRDRRISFGLSLLSTVIVILVFVLYRATYVGTDWFTGLLEETRELSIFDIISESPSGGITLVFVAVSVVLALYGLVSPRLQFLPGIVGMFSLLFTDPSFITYTWNNIPMMWEAQGGDAAYMVVFLIAALIGVAASMFMARSLNGDKGWLNSDFVQRRHGLTYFADSRWNVVLRR